MQHVNNGNYSNSFSLKTRVVREHFGLVVRFVPACVLTLEMSVVRSFPLLLPVRVCFCVAHIFLRNSISVLITDHLRPIRILSSVPTVFPKLSNGTSNETVLIGRQLSARKIYIRSKIHFESPSGKSIYADKYVAPRSFVFLSSSRSTRRFSLGPTII